MYFFVFTWLADFHDASAATSFSKTFSMMKPAVRINSMCEYLSLGVSRELFQKTALG